MKRLVCEMCGSTDLIKDGGVFICQNCGCKYSVEEAKKMMIEGTVKIDNTEKVDNLYKIARQARDSDDSENAAKYYGMIIQEDPNSWEAAFYNVYYRAMQTIIVNISSSVNSITNCLPNVFNLIKANYDNELEKKTAILEVGNDIARAASIFESSARDTMITNDARMFTYLYEGAGEDSVSEFLEYVDRVEAVYNMCFRYGDLVVMHCPNDAQMSQMAIASWEAGVNLWTKVYWVFDNYAERRNKMENTYVRKIKQYLPGYSIPYPSVSDFPDHWKQTIRRRVPNMNYI